MRTLAFVVLLIGILTIPAFCQDFTSDLTVPMVTEPAPVLSIVPEVEFDAPTPYEFTNRQIFVYTPRDANGVEVVPEPGSILALAGGLTGMGLTILRRRKS